MSRIWDISPPVGPGSPVFPGDTLRAEITVEGKKKRLWVHRKGATRAFPPGHPELPQAYKKIGQPVIIPNRMQRFDANFKDSHEHPTEYRTVAGTLAESSNIGKLKDRFPPHLRVHLGTANIRDVVHKRLRAHDLEQAREQDQHQQEGQVVPATEDVLDADPDELRQRRWRRRIRRYLGRAERDRREVRDGGLDPHLLGEADEFLLRPPQPRRRPGFGVGARRMRRPRRNCRAT